VVAATLALPAAASGLDRFSDWLTGEWSNNEQVWQQGLDAASAPRAGPAVARMHRVVTPIGHSRVHVQTRSAEGAPAGPAQWWRLSALGDSSDVRQDRVATDAPDAAALPGCGITWHWLAAEQAYAGQRDGATCAEADSLGARPGPLRLSLGVFNADGVASRKVRYFEGWIWIKHAGPQAAPDDKRASFTRRVLLHNEGQRTVVRYEDGSESPYELELAQLTYQNTRRAILKLALVDRSTGKSVSYIWANPEATSIGMNLGWFQAGLTQKAERPQFAD
jgi:hypothetical protein